MLLLYLKDGSPALLQSFSSKGFNKDKATKIISLMSSWENFLSNNKTMFKKFRDDMFNIQNQTYH